MLVFLPAHGAHPCTPTRIPQLRLVWQLVLLIHLLIVITLHFNVFPCVLILILLFRLPECVSSPAHLHFMRMTRVGSVCQHAHQTPTLHIIMMMQLLMNVWRCAQELPSQILPQWAVSQLYARPTLHYLHTTINASTNAHQECTPTVYFELAKIPALGYT